MTGTFWWVLIPGIFLIWKNLKFRFRRIDKFRKICYIYTFRGVRNNGGWSNAYCTLRHNFLKFKISLNFLGSFFVEFRQNGKTLLKIFSNKILWKSWQDYLQYKVPYEFLKLFWVNSSQYYIEGNFSISIQILTIHSRIYNFRLFVKPTSLTDIFFVIFNF